MYKYSDIRMVHLEVTERCQAACPMCLRNNSGGSTKSHIENSELSLEDIKVIFSPAFIKQLHTIYACGNYGDPIIAKDLVAIFEYFREQNSNIKLNVHTNGGARDSSWWKSLAKAIRFKGLVTFGIDGLSDTNDIYRQNVVWDKVIENAQSFIDAGGNARWMFIVFKHNEHQIDQARELAKKIGFSEIVFKKTSRFVDHNGFKTDGMSAINSKTGQRFLLEEPSNPMYRNQLTEQAADIYRSGSSQIKCKSVGSDEIYISAEGLVHPCCWTAGDMYSNPSNILAGDIWNFLSDKQSINAKARTIEQIINDSYITTFSDNWSKPSVKEGLCEVCVKNCSATADAQSAQFDLKELLN